MSDDFDCGETGNDSTVLIAIKQNGLPFKKDRPKIRTDLGKGSEPLTVKLAPFCSRHFASALQKYKKNPTHMRFCFNALQFRLW